MPLVCASGADVELLDWSINITKQIDTQNKTKHAPINQKPPPPPQINVVSIFDVVSIVRGVECRSS